MRTTSMILLSLAIPVITLAVDISPGDLYTDVRSSDPESVGIHLLTRAGVVQGYGDGYFGTSRKINRAEFLKIAILSTPENRRPALEHGVSCFPDVKADQWFAPYVCAAKTFGIVSGHADPAADPSAWLFRPEETVNYDAALKMLTLLYRYGITDVPDAKDWGEPYYRAADERGVDLPMRIRFDTSLTRGLTARLAGAFLAESDGQLIQYRLAEAGVFASSSSTSSSSSFSSSQSSSSSTSSSSSSPAALFTLPPVSHFLIVGHVSDAIASGVVTSVGESSKVAIAQVKLFSEVRSIDRLEIVTEDGELVLTLLRRVNTDLSDYKQIFDGQANLDTAFVLPQDTPTRLVLRAVIRSSENGGFADELLQVRSFSVTLSGVSSNQTTNIPLAGPFPKHQTAFGRITNVLSMAPKSGSIASGSGILMGSFSFSGTSVTGKTIALTDLVFSLYQTGQVTTKYWKLQRRGSASQATCTLNTSAMTVTCSALQSSVGVLAQLEPLILDLTADISVATGSTDASLEAWLDAAGSPEALGAVQWTDQSGTFRWIEHASPVAHGTRLQ